VGSKINGGSSDQAPKPGEDEGEDDAERRVDELALARLERDGPDGAILVGQRKRRQEFVRVGGRRDVVDVGHDDQKDQMKI